MSEGWWWSYLLGAVGIAGLYLVGRKSIWGWIIGLGAQVLWFAYAVATEQWGFIATCIAYGWVNAVSLRRWLREGQVARHRERQDLETLDEMLGER